MSVLPPIDKQNRYPALQLTGLHALERDPPAGRARIEWKLITNLPVRSRAEAIEKLDWYAMRWQIETLHKILKSGCKAEESRLRTANRLTNLIAVFCILSWRMFWITMLGRSAPRAAAELAFIHTEIVLLERVVHDTPHNAQGPPLARNVIRLAQLGGYLARASDPPPGNTVTWRGMRRLTGIQIGYELALREVGNCKLAETQRSGSPTTERGTRRMLWMVAGSGRHLVSRTTLMGQAFARTPGFLDVHPGLPGCRRRRNALRLAPGRERRAEPAVVMAAGSARPMTMLASL